MPRARFARSYFFQGRYDVDAGRSNRRGETEQDARQHRQRGCDDQDVPVQLCAQREVGPAVREQEGQEANAQDREQHAERSAERRQQHTLGQELPHDARPSRAQTQAQRDFAPSCGRATQQQACDIGASQNQD